MDDIEFALDQGIATITLNRPDRMNAISPNLEAELHRAFDDLVIAAAPKKGRTKKKS